MAVKSRKNLYGKPGNAAINAHLHSSLQHEYSAWNGFHGVLISELAAALQSQLDRTFGDRYAVDVTQALQIRDDEPNESGASTGKRRAFVPDLSIVQTSPPHQPTTAHRPLALPEATLVLSALETIYENEYLTALAIRELIDGELGAQITWIEILSDANKVGGSGYKQYREKRAATIAKGISLIEVDLLHETTSPIQGIPSYRRQESGATAYYIAVTDMRAEVSEELRNRTHIFTFGVDEAIPQIYIPLKRKDWIPFDFGACYEATYERFPGITRRVDYEQLPPEIDTYSSEDQKRILKRQRLIMNAVERGVALDDNMDNNIFASGEEHS